MTIEDRIKAARGISAPFWVLWDEKTGMANSSFDGVTPKLYANAQAASRYVTPGTKPLRVRIVRDEDVLSSDGEVAG